MFRLPCLLSLTVLCVVLLMPARAEAQPAIVIITHGDSIKHIGELPEDVAAAIRKEKNVDAKVGFIHNSFGVFWLDLWTWDGRYCLYDGDQYFELPANQIARLMGKKEKDLSKPFFYTFPPGLMLIVLGFVIWIPFSIRDRRRERELAAKFQSLMDDQRYKEAIDAFTDQIEINEARASKENADDGASQPVAEPSSHPAADPFETGVRHLVERGVDEAEARENFAFLLDILTAHAQSQAKGE